MTLGTLFAAKDGGLVKRNTLAEAIRDKWRDVAARLDLDEYTVTDRTKIEQRSGTPSEHAKTMFMLLSERAKTVGELQSALCKAEMRVALNKLNEYLNK